MFWRKSKESPKPNPRSTLVVRLRDGSTLAWDFMPLKPGAAPWRDFLRWLHGRPQSEGFVMRTADGETYFKRVDIARYTITNYEH